MITLSSLVFGILSYQRLPLTLMPPIQYPRITLRTQYQGASPYEVESLISQPIEQALGVLPNLTRITSLSHPGTSEVLCEFSWKTRVQEMILEIRENLDRVRLPEGADRPLILRYDPSLDPIMRLALYGKRPIKEIRQLAEEDIKRELESLKGIASVVIRGGAKPIVAVRLHRDRLSLYKITPQLIETRLKQENINLTGGTLREGDSLYLVRILNEFQNLGEIEKLILTYKKGAPIRLKDVADIREEAEEKKIISRIWGKEAVEILIYKEADANLIQVADRVKNRCFGKGDSKTIKKASEKQSLQSTLGKDLEIALLSDSSVFVEKAILEVQKSALYGALLAILVLLFFLHDLKNTLIIALSIPLSLLVTFAPLNMVGLSLNIMSLGGLALAAGLVVDNSIVVLEAIFRKREEGFSVRESAILGTGEIAAAVTASTLTTIAVFFPIVFVEGIAGQIFTDQSLTVTFALLISLLVALFFIPSLAAMELEGGEKRKSLVLETLKKFHSLQALSREWKGLRGRKVLLLLGLFWMIPKGLLFFLSEILGKIFFLIFALLALTIRSILKLVSTILNFLLFVPFWLFNRFFEGVSQAYLSLLAFLLRFRLLVLTLALVLCTLSGWVFFQLGARLLPELHQGEFYQEILLPPGSELAKTDGILKDVQSKLKNNSPLFQRLSSRAGSDEEDLEGKGEEGGRLYVLLENLPDLERGEDRAIKLLQKELRTYPDLEILEVKKPQILTFNTPIEIEVKGYQLETLRKIAILIARKLKNLSSLKNLRMTLKEGNPEIRVKLQRETLMRLGLNVEKIANLVRSQFKGEVPTVFRHQGDRKDIWIQLREKDRKTVEDLKNLNIHPEGKHPIPLKGVADIEIARGPQEIRRIDHSRSAVIQAEVVGLDLQKAVKEVEEELAKISLPPEVSVFVGGQYREMLTSLRSLYFALALAAFLVYVVMASIFESLAQPLVIMFTLPFAFIGVGWALYLLNQSLNVMVLIGSVMLAGIVVNNAIVLLDKINQLRKEEGKALDEAILLASALRLRPILMTTFTTIFGLLPLAIGLGEGSELRKPLAMAVLSGLCTSTVLTLILIPLTYALWESFWEKRRERRALATASLTEKKEAEIDENGKS